MQSCFEYQRLCYLLMQHPRLLGDYRLIARKDLKSWPSRDFQLPATLDLPNTVGFSLKLHSWTQVCKGLFSFFLKNIYFPVSDLSCEMWDLVPLPGIELEPPGLRVQSLSQWTTREVPARVFLPARRMYTWSTMMHA